MDTERLNEIKGQPCEACGVYVPVEIYTGNDRADGTSEYLCPDCYSGPVTVEASPDWHMPRDARCDSCGWIGDDTDLD